MTLDEACRIKNPSAFNFQAKMDRYISFIGFNAIRECLPGTPQELAREWLSDRNFNNMPLSKWDAAAGYTGFVNSQSTKSPTPNPSRKFTRILRSRGITDYTVAEAVSILKCCAELEAIEYLKAMFYEKQPPTRDLDVWAVLENVQEHTDRMNRHNIFDFECAETFRSEKAAREFERDGHGRRVAKKITIRNVTRDDVLGVTDEKGEANA